MPNLMGNYLEQSANMFMEVQEQMRKQALSFFGGFPPPETNAESSPAPEKTEEEIHEPLPEKRSS
jgi:polyhydroxyalkanoate synthesis regulator protein